MRDSYKILGVDPGTNILGYAILQVDNQQTKMITMGVIKLSKFPDHQTKLKEIFLQVQEVIETYLPTVLAVESPFFGKNVQSMLKLGRAQGVTMAAAITMGLEIVEYAPKKIKLSVTGNGNASKEQVSSMLSRMLNVKMESKYMDASDALAAAMTYYNQSKFYNKEAGTSKSWASFIKNNPKKLIK